VGDGDDDELKYDEEGGERDDGDEPEGPDDELDDLPYGDDQGQDAEYAYNDGQAGDDEAADFPPWGDRGEFQFDPRVDDRYVQHDSDDEGWSGAPTSGEFEPDGEDDEPLRL
jgi:hypothetical protein